MMNENWVDCPLPKISKDKRVRVGDLAPCKGSCHRYTSIRQTTYQLCRSCIPKYQYYGSECDVPNCDAVADGKTTFERRENKLVCRGCYSTWKTLNFCQWERFVEERHLFLARPKTFVKALEDGLVSPVENPVERKEVAECHFCHEYKTINNTKYQLCSNCCGHLQYHGETCQVCDINDAYGFNTDESIFICRPCDTTKRKYKIASFHIYKTQIRAITNCRLCGIEVSHDQEEGKNQCSAFIDHDHETDDIRGILCQKCNSAEGFVPTDLISPLKWAQNLVKYYANPPLSKSWVKK